MPRENILSGPQGNPKQLAEVVDEKSYGYANQIPILVSESLRDRCSVDTQDVAILDVQTFYDQSNSRFDSFLTRPIAMLRKFPSFDGIARLRTGNTPVLMSMDWYNRVLRRIETFTYITAEQYAGTATPKETLLIKVSASATSFQLEALVNQLNSVLSNDKFTVVDLRSQVATTRAASEFIMLVFNIGRVVNGILALSLLHACSGPGGYRAQFLCATPFLHLEHS